MVQNNEDEKGLLRTIDTAVTMNEIGDIVFPLTDYIEKNVFSTHFHESENIKNTGIAKLYRLCRCSSFVGGHRNECS